MLMAACVHPTDLHNTVSARITIVKDDVALRVAVGRAVKNAKRIKLKSLL